LISKTTAIVLRSIKYQESSLIVTLFTLEHGKIAVIAKGALRPKSKFAALLETGNILEVVYYHKANRGVQTLSDASFHLRLPNLRSDIEKMAIMMSSLELITQLLHENETNEPVFDFTLNFLNWINNEEECSALVFPYLQIRLAELFGIGLQVDENLDQDSETVFLNIGLGLLSNNPGSEQSLKLTKPQQQFLVSGVISRSSKLFLFSMSKNELSALIHHLDMYFRYHIEDIKPRKSDAIFEQMLKEDS
jgi:DNA repair protein RecO